jgi:hypothetical protein
MDSFMEKTLHSKSRKKTLRRRKRRSKKGKKAVLHPGMGKQLKMVL